MLWWLLWTACAAPDSAAPEPQDSSPPPVVCEATLPAGLWVVQDTQTAGAAGTVAWICDGGALTVEGPGGAFFVSSGGALTLNNTNLRVYVQAGASVIVNPGGTEIGDQPAEIELSDDEVVVSPCDEVIFDTSQTVEQCE